MAYGERATSGDIRPGGNATLEIRCAFGERQLTKSDLSKTGSAKNG
jgi:hypothetical protein